MLDPKPVETPNLYAPSLFLLFFLGLIHESEMRELQEPILYATAPPPKVNIRFSFCICSFFSSYYRWLELALEIVSFENVWRSYFFFLTALSFPLNSSILSFNALILTGP